MTNNEAIKWLGNLRNDLGNPHYERLWPYVQAIDEICELLEEHEPRVLTLEEARRAEYCVMEVHDRKELMQFVHDDRGGYFSPSLNGREHPYFEDIAGDDEYNVHVRCWSAIPTDEQRRKVNWE